MTGAIEEVAAKQMIKKLAKEDRDFAGFLKIGLVRREIWPYMNEKLGHDAEEQYVDSVLRSPDLNSENIEKLITSISGTNGMNSRYSPLQYNRRMNGCRIYSIGGLQGAARLYLTLEDLFQDCYMGKAKPPFLRISEMLVEEKGADGWTEHRRVMSESGTSSWYFGVLDRLTAFGLVQQDEKYCRATEKLRKIYSDQIKESWEKLSAWKYKAEVFPLK